jgi:4-amino-4-deoxy-L-arabinose transferase-like glycosyltransferase
VTESPVAPPPAPSSATARRVLWLCALATTGLHLLFAGRYGYSRDELYFIACGQHLEWGYVDQPPLIAVAARLAAVLAGTSLVGFRVPAALAAGALVALTGWLVRKLGGGAWAVALAALPVALAPIFLAHGHMHTMNSFEPLLWTGCAAVLVALLQSRQPRWWLALGLLVGVGLLNKHSMGFYAACLGLAVLLTPARRLVASRWLPLGVLLAVALVLPHVLWQHRQGWPMLELLRNGQLYKNAPFALPAFLAGQVLLLHPLSLPLWGTGLVWLLFAPGGRPWRALGLTFVLLTALFIVLKAKDYYLAPAYPPLLAAGAVVLERHVRRGATRATVLALGLAGGGALAPMTLPVLSQEAFIAWQRTLGLAPRPAERKAMGVLPQHYADQHGWEELVAAVAEVYKRLPPEEQAGTLLYAQNYGQAGALDWLGRAYGLPPARSGHNNYFLWGYGGVEPRVLLIVGGKAEDHARACGQLELAGRVPPNPYVMPYEDALPLYLCRKLKAPLATVWPRVRHYE